MYDGCVCMMGVCLLLQLHLLNFFCVSNSVTNAGDDSISGTAFLHCMQTNTRGGRSSCLLLVFPTGS